MNSRCCRAPGEDPPLLCSLRTPAEKDYREGGRENRLFWDGRRERIHIYISQTNGPRLVSGGDETLITGDGSRSQIYGLSRGATAFVSLLFQSERNKVQFGGNLLRSRARDLLMIAL